MKKVYLLLTLVMFYASQAIGQTTFAENIEKAKAGDSNAQLEIGNCYFNGNGVAKDYEQAMKWWKKSASKNNSVAQYNIGMLYDNGFGVKRNYEKAIEWYQKSADQGFAMAQFNLGCCYLNGTGVKQNNNQALVLFMLAAAQGLGIANHNVGQFYYNGWGGVKTDYAEAVKYFKKAAELGYTTSYNSAGVCYRIGGNGLTQDDAKAVEFYQKGADLNDPIAQDNLGCCYANGWGVKQDYAKAVFWLEKSVAGGREEAKGHLAEARSKAREKGVNTATTTSTKTSSGKYEKYIDAANQGDSVAQNAIGICYETGDGVEKSYEEAARWYRKAADKGYSFAQTNLGVLYVNGKGVERDYDQAMYWYQKAAKQGNVGAMNNIGVLYKYGNGVQKDYNQAAIWYKKAADKGNKKAKENLEKLEKLIQEEAKNAIPAVDKDIPMAAEVNNNTFAVIIGNEEYDNEVNVPYAANDAKVFSQYVQITLGVPEKQINLITNATLNNIRSAVRWLGQAMDICGGKGQVIFYYAGHGIPDEKNLSTYLLPTDGFGTDVESGYSLKRLYEELGKMPAKRVTVFLDACFSGAKREGGMMASARGVAIKAKSQAPAGNMVVFTAAQGDETAYPYTDMHHGMFTYYLLKKLQDTKGEVTLGEMEEYLQTEVKRQSFIENNKLQTPSVNVSQALTNSWKKMTIK